MFPSKSLAAEAIEALTSIHPTPFLVPLRFNETRSALEEIPTHNEAAKTRIPVLSFDGEKFSQSNAQVNSQCGKIYRLRPSIVLVEGLVKKKSGFLLGAGSGFLFDDQLVGTADHVVFDGKTGQIRSRLSIKLDDGAMHDARVVLRAPAEDFAFLHVPSLGNLPKLPLGSTGRLHNGDKIYTMGHPFGTSPAALMEGVYERTRAVSFTDSSKQEFKIPLMEIQIKVVQEGSSGSPVISKSGRVLGLVANADDTYARGAIAQQLVLARDELGDGIPERGWIEFRSGVSDITHKPGTQKVALSTAFSRLVVD
jgi:S1-C subfamily serine protease